MALARRTSAGGVISEEEEEETNTARLATLTSAYAIIECAVVYPYELVKTRQQVVVGRGAADGAASAPILARSSTIEYLRHLHRLGGARELYRGFSWAAAGGVPAEVLYFVGYTQAKQALLQTRAGRRNPSAVYLAAGAFADALSVLVSVPTDIISQRLQLQGMRRVDPAARPWHAMLTNQQDQRTGAQIVQSILRREGVGGLWRGTWATVATFAPNSAIWWLTHEQAKAQLATRIGCSHENAGLLAASGTLAGATSTVATTPLDVVKTRLQCSNAPVPLRTIARELIAESGWRGFYAGLGPRLWSAIPRSVCTVLAYERAVALCTREPSTRHR